MWGYEENQWIKSATRRRVIIRRVKAPAECVDIPDEIAELWRYMDLAKLLSLLQNKSLFFSRMDKLGDQFEGQWSDLTIRLLRKREHYWVEDEADHAVIVDKRGGHRLTFPKDDEDRSPEQTIRRWQDLIYRPESVLRRTYVNCWYGAKDESAAMWKLFAGEKYGIAIRTTARRFLGSFEDHLPDYFGKVKYISYDECTMPISTLPPVFYKRSAFSHEHEVRAVIAPKQREPEETEQDTIGSGVNYRVDPGYLIEEIIVSPYSPGWLHEVVDGFVRNFNLNIKVRKSALDREPSGKGTYLTVNNPNVYFASLLGDCSTTSTYIRICSNSRQKAFVIAREEWGLEEQDTNSLDVWTHEEFLKDHGCLPEQLRDVTNRFNNANLDSMDPDIP